MKIVIYKYPKYGINGGWTESKIFVEQPKLEEVIRIINELGYVLVEIKEYNNYD